MYALILFACLGGAPADVDAAVCPVTGKSSCDCGCLDGRSCLCLAKRTKRHARHMRATDGGPDWNWNPRKKVWYRYVNRSGGSCGAGGCSSGSCSTGSCGSGGCSGGSCGGFFRRR